MTWRRYKLNLRNSPLLEEYFRVMEQFDSTLSSVIDSTLSLRCNFISRLEYDTVYVASFNIISFAWSKLECSVGKSVIYLIFHLVN